MTTVFLLRSIVLFIHVRSLGVVPKLSNVQASHTHMVMRRIVSAYPKVTMQGGAQIHDLKKMVTVSASGDLVTAMGNGSLASGTLSYV